MKEFDLIVVGGGIAGLYFLNRLGELIDLASLKILVIERQSDFGKNIRCAQGLSLRWFKKYVPNYETYIINRISKFELYNSNQFLGDFSKEGEGAIIDRSKFESDLGKYVKKHCNTALNETFLSAKKEDNSYIVQTDKGRYKTKYLIGADGVENRVSKSLNLFKGLKYDEIDICAYKVIKNSNIEHDTLRFYYGNEIAPGGYLWVFPQKEGIANVGIGINGNYVKEKTPWEYLNPLIEKVYPNSEILESHVAGIPTPKYSAPICDTNFITIGDAGFAVNPFSRAGIIEALSMANLAGEQFANIIKEKLGIDSKAIKDYQNGWRKLKGKFYPYLYELKIISKDINDKELLSYKKIIDSIPHNKRTLWRVFRKILFRKPLLLWKIRKFWI